jgi:hypothetical protein
MRQPCQIAVSLIACSNFSPRTSLKGTDLIPLWERLKAHRAARGPWEGQSTWVCSSTEPNVEQQRIYHLRIGQDAVRRL